MIPSGANLLLRLRALSCSTCRFSEGITGFSFCGNSHAALIKARIKYQLLPFSFWLDYDATFNIETIRAQDQ
jgi:hypothetical protein